MKFKIATLLSLALLSCAHAEKKPNTLFSLVEDMGSLDPSFPFYYKGKEPVVTESNKLFSTPNMEERASNGRLFTNAYAYSVCSPTRVTLLSDQAAPRHRVTTWTHPQSSKVDTGAIRTDKLTHFPHGCTTTTSSLHFVKIGGNSSTATTANNGSSMTFLKTLEKRKAWSTSYQAKPLS